MRALHATTATRDTQNWITGSAETRAVGVSVFWVVVGLWVAFGVAALVRPTFTDEVWSVFVRLPIGIQVPTGLLFLPWIAAVAIAGAGLEPWLRDAIVLSLAFLSAYLVYPRKI
jgi:hypothetical protein